MTPTTPTRSGLPFIFLAFAWALAGVSILLPFADSVFAKALLLFTPITLSLLAPLLDARAGFALWSVTIGFLVSQTGFQADIAGIRTSILEFVLLLLMPILLWTRRFRSAGLDEVPVPGQPWLALFVSYSAIMLLIGLYRGAHIEQAVQVLKGFVLYPVVIYILITGVHRKALLHLTVAIALMFFGMYAIYGFIDFAGHQRSAQSIELYRSSAEFASINTFGVTFAVIALFVFGIGLSLRRPWQRFLMIAYACTLFLAAATSVARTVWLVFAVGLLYLITAGRQRSLYPLLVLTIGGVLLFSTSNPVTDRVLQLSDSSTVKRSYYLTSGLAGFTSNWLTGWGWGMTYWANHNGEGGVAVPGTPWFHNEYLNLGVQTGIIGVGLYLGFWLSILRYGHIWLIASPDPTVTGYVRGGQAALIGLFVAAATEHVWWKADIAGLGVWLAGVMIAAIRLSTVSNQQPLSSTRAEQK